MDSVEASTQQHKLYIQNIKESLITTANNCFGNINSRRNAIKSKKQKREVKQMYGEFKRKTGGKAYEKKIGMAMRGKSFERN